MSKKSSILNKKNKLSQNYLYWIPIRIEKLFKYIVFIDFRLRNMKGVVMAKKEKLEKDELIEIENNITKSYKEKSDEENNES